MKYIFFLFLISLFLFISCKDELVTNNNQYDLNKIQNDTDWVEIIDTQNIEIKCLYGEFVKDRYLITDSLQYLKFYEFKSNIKYCKDYKYPDINFNKYTLIGFLFNTHKAEIQKYIFINQHEKSILLKIQVKNLSKEWDIQGNEIWNLIPRVTSDYSIITDITEI